MKGNCGNFQPKPISPDPNIIIRWKVIEADGKSAAICSTVPGSYRLRFFNNYGEAMDFVSKSNGKLDVKL
jgi:hypothetical protein